MNKSNIVLIGFMGMGKTTIGKIISEKLDYKFVDTDEEIVSKLSMSINDIFKISGEEYFRDIEFQTIERVSKYNRSVIACGGGVIKNFDNIYNLKKNGIVICLTADFEIIWKRIMTNNERPLIKDKSKYDIMSLFKERQPLYNKAADVCVNTSNECPSAIADRIIDIYMEITRDALADITKR